MRIRIPKTVSFEDAPHEFGVAIEQLVEHFEIINMVATLLLQSGRGIEKQLVALDGLDYL